MKYKKVKVLDISPIPQCYNPPASGFYTEYDFIMDSAVGNTAKTSNITNYTCTNGDKTFEFVCDVNGVKSAQNSCLDAGGNTFYGLGYLQYAGPNGQKYNIQVTITNLYTATSYINGTNSTLTDYTVPYTGSTPGIEIFVDGDRNGSLQPGHAYGGKKDNFDGNRIVYSQTYKLGTSSGTSNDQLHFKILNPLSEQVRAIGNIYITPA